MRVLKFLTLILGLSTITLAQTAEAQQRPLNPMHGVAFSDVESMVDFNKWIRANTKEVLGTDVKDLLDSLNGQYANEGYSYIRLTDGSYAFRKYTFSFDPEFKVEIGETIPLDSTEFRVDVDIYNRQVMISDLTEGSDLLLVFPIAHGGLTVLNQGVSTPIFRNAFLDKNTIISERTTPSYFKGRPFIRVMTNENPNLGWTGIGFHILQNPSLARRPDSHGCMRLRSWDLDTMHAIFKYQARRHSHLDIHPKLDLAKVGIPIHPYTIDNSKFKKERNYGSVEKPSTRRGKDGLTIYETVTSSPIEYLDQIVDRELQAILGT
ncbi:MAG: L,D-transpeptidase [Bdellovibrionales bacterium]|nr:L,D-transpeptidase [Bdellovibrionales bacterium]